MENEIKFSIKVAKKASKKDLAAALAIYVDSVDSNGITKTNEILYYIENSKIDEKREMFFYVLYNDSEVCGFAEAGYLHDVDAIIIDYLCTNPRNPTLFFNFYNLMISAIENSIGKSSTYRITELTTTTNSENKLCDADSNYFRKMLSFENFKIVRAPYYCPSLCLRKNEKEQEYNLAINGNLTSLSKSAFLAIVKSLYYDHNLTWYLKFDEDLSNEAVVHIDYLFKKVQDELSKKDVVYDAEFLLVNCKIYDEGNCTHVDTQNITRKRRLKKRFRRFLLLSAIALGAISTGLLAIFLGDSRIFAAIGAAITAGLTITEIIRSLKSK